MVTLWLWICQFPSLILSWPICKMGFLTLTRWAIVRNKSKALGLAQNTGSPQQMGVLVKRQCAGRLCALILLWEVG